MNEKIETLAREKDFAALSDSERSLVLQEMSQASFEQLRRVLLAARRLDVNVQPPAHLKGQLMDRITAVPKPAWLPRIFRVAVPVWQAAVAMALTAVVLWPRSADRVEIKYVPKVQMKTDTLWKEKIVWRERVVVREKRVYRDRPVVEPIAAWEGKTDTETVELELTRPEFTSPRVGTSLGDTPELLLFFTQGDK